MYFEWKYTYSWNNKENIDDSFKDLKDNQYEAQLSSRSLNSETLLFCPVVHHTIWVQVTHSPVVSPLDCENPKGTKTKKNILLFLQTFIFFHRPD